MRPASVTAKAGNFGYHRRTASRGSRNLTGRIDTIEADIQNTKGRSPQTPSGGMQTLERAHKRNIVAKRKNRRMKLGKTKKWAATS